MYNKTNYDESKFLFPEQLPMSDSGLPFGRAIKDGLQCIISVIEDGPDTVEVLFGIDEYEDGVKRTIRKMSKQLYIQDKHEFYIWANVQLLNLKEQYELWKKDGIAIKLG